MIDFEYWLSNLVGTCELIASETAFQKVWVERDYSFTSIHYYDELYVQLVDGLHIDELVTEFAPRIGDQGTIASLLEFARSLHILDASIEGKPALKDPEVLLSSPEWRLFQQAARKVVKSPGAATFRDGRRNEEILARLNAEHHKRA